MRLKNFIISTLFCTSLYAADTTNSPSNATNASAIDKMLVEVAFATDDRAENQTGHTIILLWMSETKTGMYRQIYNWATQGGSSPDADTLKKAAECLKLLKQIEQPKKLPESPNDVVTVRCLDGDDMIVKKFPIDQVPSEVHQILAVMGFGDDSRLKFIQKPGQPAFTNTVNNTSSFGTTTDTNSSGYGTMF
jgi:hypothetical protein